MTSLRLDEDLIREARALGINVSQAAREGIREAIRRKRMLENVDWLAAQASASEPAEDLVRRMRDERLAHLESLVGKGRKHGNLRP